MKPVACLLLLVSAVWVGEVPAARADHVWRMFCGAKHTPVEGAFDTSAACKEEAVAWGVTGRKLCRDTKDGPHYVNRELPYHGELITAGDGRTFATCQVWVDYMFRCQCEPVVLSGGGQEAP